MEGAGKLRNSEVKLRWWWVVVVGGGGMRGFSRQVDFVDLVNKIILRYVRVGLNIYCGNPRSLHY